VCSKYKSGGATITEFLLSSIIFLISSYLAVVPGFIGIYLFSSGFSISS
jgi:hypothetical protein